MFCLRALYVLEEIERRFFDAESTDADASIDRGARKSCQLCSIQFYISSLSFSFLLSFFLFLFFSFFYLFSRDKFKRALATREKHIYYNSVVDTKYKRNPQFAYAFFFTIVFFACSPGVH